VAPHWSRLQFGLANQQYRDLGLGQTHHAIKPQAQTL
jgi:hypothetical protein